MASVKSQMCSGLYINTQLSNSKAMSLYDKIKRKIRCNSLCTPVQKAAIIGKSFDFQSGQESFVANMAKYFVAVKVITSELPRSEQGILFEGIILLAVNLYQCHTVAHMVSIFTAYVHSVVRLSSVADSFIDELKHMFDDNLDPNAPLELQAGFSVKDLFDKWQLVCTSEFGQKVRRFVGSLVTFGVCSSAAIPFSMEFYNKLFGENLFSQVLGSDLIGYAVDMCTFLLDRGLECWNTGNMWSLFCDSAMDKADRDFIDIQSARTHYITSALHLSPAFSDEHEYCLKMSQCKDIYLSALKRAKALPVKAYFERKLSVLASIEADIQHYDQAMSVRKSPFALLLFGPPGTGKTAVLNELSNILLRINGLESNPATKVSLNCNDKYQSEYKSHHKVVVLDDISNTSADKVQESPLRLIIDMINNDPKMALNADVSLKGRIAFKPLIVLGTTNVKSLQSGSFSISPAAVMRRFNFIITFKVKPEFGINGMIDSTTMVNEVNDAWMFTVERAFPDLEDPRVVKYIVHTDEHGRCVDIGLDRLIKIIGPASKLHLEQQRRVVEVASGAFSRPLCPHGSLASICSDCLQPQSGVNDFYEWFLAMDRWPMHLARALDFGQGQWLQGHLTKLKWDICKTMSVKWLYGALASCFGFVNLLSMVAFGSLGIFSLSFSGIFTGFVGTSVLMAASNMVKEKADQLLTRDLKRTADRVWRSGIVQTLTLVGLFYTFRKVYKMLFKFALQGSNISSPKPDETLKQDVWLKPTIVKPDANFGMNGATMEQFVEVIRGSLARGVFSTSGTNARTACNLFPYKSNCWFVPYHVLSKGFDTVAVTYSIGNLSPNRVSTFDGSNWVRIGQSDMCLLTLLTQGSVRDMSQWFPLLKFDRPSPGVHIHYDSNMDFKVNKVSYVPCDYEVPGIGTYPAAKFRFDNCVTGVGMCVAPLISAHGPPMIVGLHTMGITGEPIGLVATFTRYDVDCAFSKLYSDETTLNFEVASRGEMDFQMTYDNLELLGELHRKSPFNFMEEDGPIRLYGAHSGRRRTFKSSVCDSYIAGSVQHHFGVEQIYGPPKNIGSWKPWHADAKGLLSIRDVNAGLLRQSYLDLLRSQDEFIDSYTISRLQEDVHPIPLVNVLAGADCVMAVDRMDLGTSTGWPYNQPKNKVIFASEEIFEGVSCPLELDSEILKAVCDLEAKYLRGERGNCVFRVSLKDEPTKLTKEKVRTIAGSPLVLTILTRKYFLMIIKLIRSHPYDFESAVGINAYGSEWDSLVCHIKRFGDDRIVAGDFAMYDTLMSAMMTYTSFKLLIRLARFAGYSDEQLRVMRGIATDICEPIYEYNGEFIGLVGSNASGHGLTVIINNYGNMLYQRMGYYDVYDGKPPGLYNKYVSALNFGDDNLIGVSAEADKFNHTSLQKTLADNHLTYTMADKTSASRPFIKLEEATFLRRSFRFANDIGKYVAPLDNSSILKSLLSSKGSKVVCPQQLAADALLGAATEYFLHGEEKYEYFRERALQIIAEKDLILYMQGTIDPYSVVLRDYKKKYPS